MKVKHTDIEFFAGILTELGDRTEPYLVYFVAGNTLAITPVLKAIGAVRVSLQGSEVYERAHLVLCMKNARKDEQGRPICQRAQSPQGMTTTYAIEDQAIFDIELQELNQKYVGLREQMMAREEQIHRLLREEVEIELVSIRMSECADAITGNMASFLMRLGILEWDIERPGQVRKKEK